MLDRKTAIVAKQTAVFLLSKVKLQTRNKNIIVK